MEFMAFMRVFLFIAITASFNGIFGFDLASLPGRLMCFKNIQPNCNEDCTSAYPQLSLSITNGTKACTWFLLYTNKNPEEPELLHKCGGKLPPNTNFNPDRQLVIIINAYNIAYCNIAAFREWKNQILKKGDYNVLIIDWTWGNFIDHYSDIQNAKITAKQTIIVLKNIQEQVESPLNIYIIGHSTAAHIAGMIGQGIAVKRITGLDPAGRGYSESEPLSERLDPSDAKLVDVWHCNAGDCLPSRGINYDAGHIDYYINGGSMQLSCYDYAFAAIPKGDFLYALAAFALPSLCSHLHCLEYFKESIHPDGCQYIGVKCNRNNLNVEEVKDFRPGHCNECGENGENCEIMGMDFGNYNNKSANARGRYYVRTGFTCDYCDNSHVKLQEFADEYKEAVEYRDTS